MPLLSVLYWGCCLPKDCLTQFWLQCPYSSPSLPEEKMAGPGTRAKLICVGNSWPYVSRSGLRGHLSMGLMNPVLQLPLLSLPCLSWGRGTSPGPVCSLKCSCVSWASVSAASHLTSPFHRRCSMYVHLETLTCIDSSSFLSYNDPRFLSKIVCSR